MLPAFYMVDSSVVLSLFAAVAGGIFFLFLAMVMALVCALSIREQRRSSKRLGAASTLSRHQQTTTSSARLPPVAAPRGPIWSLVRPAVGIAFLIEYTAGYASIKKHDAAVTYFPPIPSVRSSIDLSR